MNEMNNLVQLNRVHKCEIEFATMYARGVTVCE